MIDVSIEPSQLVAGRRSQLAIRFMNTGRGPCSNIIFKLGLPSGIRLVRGLNRVEIPVIQAGRAHVHEVVIEPIRSGKFDLTSINFSYRDELDSPVRRSDFRWTLTVQALPAPQPAQADRPVPRLQVEHAGGELLLGEWDVLQVMVRNATGFPLSDVTIAVDGPFRTDGKRSRVPLLRNGKSARASFSVIACEGGRHVPYRVSTTYGYPDGNGSFRSRTQDDNLEVVVTKPGTPEPPAETLATRVAKQTILYLAASPRDMEPLRSDLEMRKVQERMQLARHSDRYGIEYRPAARLVDVTQALLDFEPQVVHFSGHGQDDGCLFLEDENGFSKAATPEGLAGLFGQHKSAIQCVIVNACHSLRLATAMARHIRYVVGMRCEIGDEAAIIFSVGFYQGIFGGQSVPDAFDRGCLHLLADPTTEREHQTPVLLRPSGA